MARKPKSKPPPKPKSTDVTRKDGRHLRRLTIYLSAELALRLRVFCAISEREYSEVVTVGLSEYLAAKGS